MKKSRIKSLVLSAALILGSLSTVANAATVYTTEFGTFSYGITKNSSNQVQAYTTITKTGKTVRTTIEVQDNATGARVFTNTATGSTSAYTLRWTNISNRMLACFSSHEARGTSSYVKYMAKTF